MRAQNTLSLVAFLSVGSAHTIFSQLQDGTTNYGTSYAIRDPTYDGPITDVTSNPIACNGGPNPTIASNNIITVKAGDTVQAIWRHTLTSTEANDNIYVIDPSHKGPTIAYLKKVTDATADVGYGSGWFKIQEAGLNAATQDWATTDLIANGGLQSITIPECIEDGQYLLRAELIALHGANSPNGAQFYMECAQINVTGGTGTVTPSTVSFPGAYKANDPGILINIYQTLQSYTIPGPELFTCDASSSGTAPSAGESGTPPTPTTLATVVAPGPSIPAVAPSAAAGGAALYAQCGGTGWSGPTTCAQGTCVASGSYYSQCVPS